MNNQAKVYEFRNCFETGMSFEEIKASDMHTELMCEDDEWCPLFTEVFKHVTVSDTVQANDASEFGVYDVADDEWDNQQVIIARDEDHAAQLFFKHHLARG